MTTFEKRANALEVKIKKWARGKSRKDKILMRKAFLKHYFFCKKCDSMDAKSSAFIGGCLALLAFKQLKEL